MSAIIQQEVEKAQQALRRGRVLLYPTDTIWGLGCDINNESAVKRIHEIKNQPVGSPLVLLVSNIRMLTKYISHIHPRIETLLSHHVQPLTIIYKASDNLPHYLVSEDDTIAIRITRDPFCKHLIHLIDQPLIATSASSAGQPLPASFEDIESRVIEMADDIINPSLQNNQTPHLPSVIASYNRKGELVFIRN